MGPQHGQDLAVAPARRHGPVGGLEGADGLGPLAGARRQLLVLLVLLVRGPVRLGLRGPVVDVPVVLVQEAVVGVELGWRQGCQVGGGEGGQDEVRLQRAALARLVCGCGCERASQGGREGEREAAGETGVRSFATKYRQVYDRYGTAWGVGGSTRWASKEAGTVSY